MSKQIEVKLKVGLSGTEYNLVPGDTHKCSKDEAIRHYLKGSCEAPEKGTADFIKAAETYQKKTGFGLAPHERAIWEAEQSEQDEADETEDEKSEDEAADDSDQSEQDEEQKSKNTSKKTTKKKGKKK